MCVVNQIICVYVAEIDCIGSEQRQYIVAAIDKILMQRPYK